MATSQIRDDTGEDADAIDAWYALCPHCMVLVEVSSDDRGKPEPCDNCGLSLRESLKVVKMVRVRWHVVY